MKYILWEWNGHYIKGNKIYTYASKQAAETRAQKLLGYHKTIASKTGWLIVNEAGQPIGCIEKYEEK